MEVTVKQNTNIDKSKLIIIGGILISVLFIFTLLFLILFGDKGGKNREGEIGDDSQTKELATGDTNQMTAVFLESNTQEKEITVSNVLSGEQVTFVYSGGTQITDKYEQLITISQFVKGQVVNLSYLVNTNRLTQLSIAGDIWENIGVTDVKINSKAKVISYLDNNYSYGAGTVIISEDKIIPIEDIQSMDYLTILGYEENIYSIVVTSGHGYLELAGDEQFIGGTIYVGTLLMEQISDGMKLMVPEGTHMVTVNNGAVEGSKEIEIKRNLTSICEVQEFALEPVKTGLVQFDIQPEGANLFIDQEQKTFVEPISLSVGEHTIEVSLGGYVSYKGTLQVDTFGTTVTVTLYENQAPTTNTNDNTQEDLSGNGSTSTHSDVTSGESNDNEEQPSGNNSDNTSEVNQGTNQRGDETITIKWTTGAEVFFNGEYVGVIEDGKLTVDKPIGKVTVDLVIEGEDTITYEITVEDDGQDAVFSFPER